MSSFRFIPLVFVLLCLGGCGGSPYQPVHGKLVFTDGTAITGLACGQVVFDFTDTDGKKHSASGPIKADGTFILGTERPGDGAVVGKHKALIAFPTSAGDIPPPQVILGKYTSFEKSGLEFEVKPGPNEFTITLEGVGKRK